MPSLERSQGLIRFEGFELDLRAAELRPTSGRNVGKAVRLAEQPFLILTMLLERPGQVVTREEIRKRLWPNDTIVEFEHSISAAMNRLRQALGDSAENPRYIETLARRGYRFISPVQEIAATTEPSPEDQGGQSQTIDFGAAPYRIQALQPVPPKASSRSARRFHIIACSMCWAAVAWESFTGPRTSSWAGARR